LWAIFSVATGTIGTAALLGIVRRFRSGIAIGTSISLGLTPALRFRAASLGITLTRFGPLPARFANLIAA
jgi:hypothetical protein